MSDSIKSGKIIEEFYSFMFEGAVNLSNHLFIVIRNKKINQFLT